MATKINTIEQVISRGAGDTTPSITGQVTGVWPPKTGTKPPKQPGGKPFQWSRQMILMGDGNNKIGVIVWNHEAISEQSKGRNLTITCDEAMKIGEYNDNLQLEVPREAKLQWEGDAPEASTASRNTGGASSPSPAQRNAPQGQRESKFTPSDVQAAVNRYVAGLKMAVEGAAAVADHANSLGIEFGPDAIERIAVHISMGVKDQYACLPSGKPKDAFEQAVDGPEETPSELFGDGSDDSVPY